MPKKLKVYSWTEHVRGSVIKALGVPDHHRQHRAFVAATSMADAARRTQWYLRRASAPRQLFCLGETGNEDDVRIAMADPGQVFVRPLDHGPYPDTAVLMDFECELVKPSYLFCARHGAVGGLNATAKECRVCLTEGRDYAGLERRHGGDDVATRERRHR